MTTQNSFVLSSPAVGAADVSIKPILSWTAYPGAKWYEVTVSEDPTFAIPEWSHNVNGLVYGVVDALKYGTTYYWRVRGVTADPYVQGTKVITPSGPYQTGAFITQPEPSPSPIRVRKTQPVQVFVSHTQKDVEFCDIFDRACARVGIRAFRSEFEKIEYPAWKTIREAIENSCALFLVVGKELVKAQSSHDPSWEYTQNWIAYEIGVACEKGLDVWVICDDTTINFPMPYLNNYLPVSLRNKESFDYFVYTLQRYAEGLITNFPRAESVIQCPYIDCKATYNLNIKVTEDILIVCPQCLHTIPLTKGWSSTTQDTDSVERIRAAVKKWLATQSFKGG